LSKHVLLFITQLPTVVNILHQFKLTLLVHIKTVRTAVLLANLFQVKTLHMTARGPTEVT